ncbi:MAG: HAMP domain-containing sensor histidine kinase [Eubacteriales bacterium]|nr:HAMP domain-containing sensor histidine kinase [Eubacteriales bacterium]
MNKIRKKWKDRLGKSAGKIVLQYWAAMAGFTVVFLVGGMFCWKIVSNWSSRMGGPVGDFLFGLIRLAIDYAPVVVAVPLLVGYFWITASFMARPLRYLDALVSAAERLARPESGPVELPAELSATENELNLVRERVLREARTARETERQKNDLVVYLAHDLKTPLTSVIGYLTLLRDEPQLSEQLRQKYLGVALGKAQRLEELINEFFDITRFNLSRIVLEEEPVNLTRLLEQTASEFLPVLEEKGMRWQLALADRIQIVGDPDKLARVFDNLFRNAVNYGDAGSDIAVTLSGEERQAVVRVKNAGRTIPPEKLERIFEQFFRLDSARQSGTGGAGLGLAIAKQIVECHGGTICAQSSGGSVTFCVALPLDEVHEAERSAVWSENI